MTDQDEKMARLEAELKFAKDDLKRAEISKKMDNARRTNEVIIKDIQMPFISMVVFMVKWVIASIPAAFILFLIAIAFYILLGAMGYIALR